jgi:hypothetical protein
VVVGAKDEPRRVAATRGCYSEIQDCARENDLPCQAEFFEIPDGIHSGYINWTRAGKFLFKDLPIK